MTDSSSNPSRTLLIRLMALVILAEIVVLLIRLGSPDPELEDQRTQVRIHSVTEQYETQLTTQRAPGQPGSISKDKRACLLAQDLEEYLAGAIDSEESDAVIAYRLAVTADAAQDTLRLASYAPLLRAQGSQQVSDTVSEMLAICHQSGDLN